MSYCAQQSIINNFEIFFKEIYYLDNGKDKVMFLTKDDLSSPSTIKQKEDEKFDPWEQHGIYFPNFKIRTFSIIVQRFNFTKWFN